MGSDTAPDFVARTPSWMAGKSDAKGCGPREPHEVFVDTSSLVLRHQLAEVFAAARALRELLRQRHARVELLLRARGGNAQREDAHVDRLLIADLFHPVLVRRQRVLVRHVDARPHAELDELALEDLALDLVAEVLLGEPAPHDLAHDVGGGDRPALRRLRLRGDVRDAAVDLFGGDRDVRLVGLLLFETIVDHPVEELFVHLLFLDADDVRVVRLHPDLDAPRHGPVEQFGPQHRPLADHGHHALDDRRASRKRRGNDGQSRQREKPSRKLHVPRL